LTLDVSIASSALLLVISHLGVQGPFWRSVAPKPACPASGCTSQPYIWLIHYSWQALVADIVVTNFLSSFIPYHMAEPYLEDGKFTVHRACTSWWICLGVSLATGCRLCSPVSVLPFQAVFFLLFFIYSHVHTLFGSVLPPAPTLSPAFLLASRQILFCPYL
jgi:hypothetical protein